MIKKTSLSKPINDFYREIIGSNFDENGNSIVVKRNIFDYYKIWEDPSPVFLIISERGLRAKTTEAKRLALYIKKKYDGETGWLMNTQPLLDKEKRNHLSKPKRFLEGFEDVVMGKAGAVLKGDKKPYTFFTPISKAENEKGSRPDAQLLVYDEFNVATSHIAGDQIELFTNLLASMMDPINAGDQSNLKKIIIHGNFKTLNHPLIYNLGIYTIEKEVTVILDDNGSPLITILCPQPTLEEINAIKKENKYNWRFKLIDKLGQTDHVYFNKSVQDNVNYVDKDLMLRLNLSGEKLWYALKNKNYLMGIIKYKENYEGEKIYVYHLKDNNSEKIYTTLKNSIGEKISYIPQLKYSLVEWLGKGLIKFDSLVSREKFLESLR